MPELSAQTLVMAVQAVDAEMDRIQDTAGGDITELEPDAQELLLAYSLAAMELKASYLHARASEPGLPAYERLVSGR